MKEALAMLMFVLYVGGLIGGGIWYLVRSHNKRRQLAALTASGAFAGPPRPEPDPLPEKLGPWYLRYPSALAVLGAWAYAATNFEWSTKHQWILGIGTVAFALNLFRR